MQKSLYKEDDLPLPPTPPLVREISLDGPQQLGSLENRTIRRKSSIERELVAELHKVNLFSLLNFCFSLLI